LEDGETQTTEETGEELFEVDLSPPLLSVTALHAANAKRAQMDKA
jgi:hypothetical protein